MHQPGHEPLQQLALTQRDDRLVAEAGGHLARAVARRRHPHQPEEQQGAAGEEPARDGQHDQERGEGDRVYPPLAFSISAVMAGSTSCRSPITA